ncbi:MAG: alginate export family protein [Terracidiphilus sp.]
MLSLKRIAAFPAALLLAASLAPCAAQPAQPANSPVSFSIFDSTRVDSWQWFAAPPYANSYGYVESLLRVGIAQRIHRWDWQLELSQPAILDAPGDAVSSNSAQGQLGLGGTYDAANNNSYPAAAFLKQGFVRFGGEDASLRAGRFEFLGGEETKPANPSIAWLQTNRIAQRLVGNFGFSNAQRSFDGLDAHLNAGGFNVTAMAARADQGVFNMNGNPELNVDLQFLALTRPAWKDRVLWRVFALGYHDGRTGLTKTDNRTLAVRQTDHENIRLGTYGGDLLAVVPTGVGRFDFLFWGALQNGSWGAEGDSANAAALEGGYQAGKQSYDPWLRGGWFRGSGDNNPADGTHNTFFQVLPTPRVYARLPFYNLMNSTDEFVQMMDKPVKRVTLRSDLHWLQLTSAHDLWYLGGGAFDNKVFGMVGRPSNGSSSLASVLDASANWQATSHVGLNFYYAYAWGKTVAAAIYPTNRDMQWGFVEFDYHWGLPQKK